MDRNAVNKLHEIKGALGSLGSMRWAHFTEILNALYKDIESIEARLNSQAETICKFNNMVQGIDLISANPNSSQYIYNEITKQNRRIGDIESKVGGIKKHKAEDLEERIKRLEKNIIPFSKRYYHEKCGKLLSDCTCFKEPSKPTEPKRGVQFGGVTDEPLPSNADVKECGCFCCEQRRKLASDTITINRKIVERWNLFRNEETWEDLENELRRSLNA